MPREMLFRNGCCLSCFCILLFLWSLISIVYTFCSSLLLCLKMKCLVKLAFLFWTAELSAWVWTVALPQYLFLHQKSGQRAGWDILLPGAGMGPDWLQSTSEIPFLFCKKCEPYGGSFHLSLTEKTAWKSNWLLAKRRFQKTAQTREPESSPNFP